MTYNLFKDLHDMHVHYDVDAWVIQATDEELLELLKLRIRMLTEEHKEAIDAFLTSDPEELVDALVDITVIAMGTLDLFGVNGQQAWSEVLRANMSKRVGIKEGRRNDLGLPDLVKPNDWYPPDHSVNLGHLPDALRCNRIKDYDKNNHNKPNNGSNSDRRDRRDG